MREIDPSSLRQYAFEEDEVAELIKGLDLRLDLYRRVLEDVMGGGGDGAHLRALFDKAQRLRTRLLCRC